MPEPLQIDKTCVVRRGLKVAYFDLQRAEFFLQKAQRFGMADLNGLILDESDLIEIINYIKENNL